LEVFTPESGQFSGERFRREFLVPALRKYDQVVVDASGTLTLGSSFLEESFGGLVRREDFDESVLKAKLKVVSEDRQALSDRVWAYIHEAQERRSKAALNPQNREPDGLRDWLAAIRCSDPEQRPWCICCAISGKQRPPDRHSRHYQQSD